MSRAPIHIQHGSLVTIMRQGHDQHPAMLFAEQEKLQVMKEQIKLDVSSYNPHMMRLTHFIRKARRNFQGAKSSRVQQNAGQPQEGQVCSASMQFCHRLALVSCQLNSLHSKAGFAYGCI